MTTGNGDSVSVENFQIKIFLGEIQWQQIRQT